MRLIRDRHDLRFPASDSATRGQITAVRFTCWRWRSRRRGGVDFSLFGNKNCDSFHVPMTTNDSRAESPAPADDPELHPDDAALQQRLAYDEYIFGGRGSAEFEATDSGFAKIVRLMHDTLGQSVGAELPLDGDPTERVRSIPTLPDPFGRFEHLGLIGQGVFGSVWKATDPRLQREVALKIPHPEVRLDAQLSHRFLREARAAARLNHPAIVRVHEAGVIDDVPYMASEYVAGESLSERLRRVHCLAPAEASTIVRQLADAADHAHRHHVVHRDIKPENVLLPTPANPECKDLPARLTDFGLARLADEDCDLSRTGLLVGTPNYMAPEQFLAADSSRDISVDIYSLGVLLYESIAGVLPRDFSHNVRALWKQSGQIQSLRQRRPEVPQDLDAICMRCLQVDPTARYQSAAELRDDLDRFLNGKPTVARPMGPVESVVRWSRRHQSAATAIAAVFLSLCTVIAVMGMWRLEGERQNKRLAAALAAGESARRAALTSEQRYREISWNTGMQHAYQLYAEGDLLASGSTLDQLAGSHPTYLSRPEWKLLRAELNSQYIVLHQADRPLRDVVVVPESNLVAIGGDRANVELIDLYDGRVLESFLTNLQHADAIAVEPGGRRIAVGGATNAFNLAAPILISMDSGRIETLPCVGPTTIESLAFSPSGRFLATGFRYEGIALAEIPAQASPVKTNVQRLPGDRRNLSVTWTSDEQLILQPSFETLRVVGPDGSDSRIITRNHGFRVFGTFPSQEKVAASFFHDRSLEVIELEHGETELFLSGSTAMCNAVAVSADGMLIAAGQDDGQLVFWRLADALSLSPSHGDNHRRELDPFARIRSHGGAITGISWHGQSLISVGEDGRVARVNVSDGVATDGSAPQPTAAEFLPGSTEVLLGFSNGELWRVDAVRLLSDHRRRYIIDLHHRCRQHGQKLGVSPNTAVTALAVADDASRYAASFSNGRLDVFRIPDNQTLLRHVPDHSLPKAESLFDDIEFGRGGKYVYWTGDDNFVNGCALIEIPHKFAAEFGSDVECLRTTPDGRQVAVGGQFEGVHLLDSASGTRTGPVIGVNSLSAFTFVGGNGGDMIAGGRDGTIRRFSLTDGTQSGIWKPCFSEIRDLVCTADGNLGISLDLTDHISFWNPRTELIYGRLRVGQGRNRHHAHVRSALIADDQGKLLLTLLVRRREHVIESQFRLFELR